MLPTIEYINPKAIRDLFQWGRVATTGSHNRCASPILGQNQDHREELLPTTRTKMKELKKEYVDEIYEDRQNFYIFDQFRPFLTISESEILTKIIIF